MGIVDYWSGTFKQQSQEQVRSLVSRYVDTWLEVRGAHGYAQCWATEGFRVYYAGTPGMGVYLQVSGEGCAKIAELDGAGCWGAFAQLCIDNGFRASRIDVAFDDTSGAFSASEVIAQFERGEVATHLRCHKVSRDVRDGEVIGSMLHIGRIDSDTNLCIYDKRLERIARGLADPGSWVRFELRYRGKRSDEFLHWVKEHGDLSGAEGFLAAVIEFKTPITGKLRSAWGASAWWLDFLNRVNKVRIYRSAVTRSVSDRALRWVRVHAATLAMLCLCMQDGKLEGRWLTETVKQGWVQMRDSHDAVVEAHLGRKVNNVNPRYRGLEVPK